MSVSTFSCALAQKNVTELEKIVHTTILNYLGSAKKSISKIILILMYIPGLKKIYVKRNGWIPDWTDYSKKLSLANVYDFKLQTKQTL